MSKRREFHEAEQFDFDFNERMERAFREIEAEQRKAKLQPEPRSFASKRMPIRRAGNEH